MMGMCNLFTPHAELKVSLPGRKCSPVLCELPAPLCLNDRMVEAVVSAHTAGSQAENECSLHSVPAVQMVSP